MADLIWARRLLLGEADLNIIEKFHYPTQIQAKNNKR